MKKLIITLIVLAVIAGSVGAYYKYRTPEQEVKISKLAVARGDVIESVGATGTLQAVKTVQVGSQVSGNIKALYADFNTIVKKGQIVAELDPSLIQTQIEKQLPLNIIEATVKRAREVQLISVVCVDTVDKAKIVAGFNPDSIAIEPPELIGSGISVSKAKPEVVSGAVKAVKVINPKVRVLCGAGITNGEDVIAAQKLGAEGILVASGVVKAKDPQAALLDLARSLRH